MCDKNWNDIFEGDIVKQCYEDIEYGHGYSTEDFGRVFWQGSQLSRTSLLFPDYFVPMYDCHKYEIIGNIYDNPELLDEIKKSGLCVEVIGNNDNSDILKQLKNNGVTITIIGDK